MTPDRQMIEEFRRNAKQWRPKSEETDFVCDLALQALAQQWVSVAERLPKYGVPVLLVIGGTVQQTAAVLDHDARDGRRWEWLPHFEADPAPLEAATHWMPLPDPPKK